MGPGCVCARCPQHALPCQRPACSSTFLAGTIDCCAAGTQDIALTRNDYELVRRAHAEPLLITHLRGPLARFQRPRRIAPSLPRPKPPGPTCWPRRRHLRAHAGPSCPAGDPRQQGPGIHPGGLPGCSGGCCAGCSNGCCTGPSRQSWPAALTARRLSSSPWRGQNQHWPGRSRPSRRSRSIRPGGRVR